MQPNTSVKTTIYAIVLNEKVETTGFPMISDLHSVSKLERQSKRSVLLDSRPMIVAQMQSYIGIHRSLLNLKYMALG